MAYILPLSQWLPLSSLYFCSVIISSRILYSEICKRRASDNVVLFTTKWSKFCSISCIICSVLLSLSGILDLLPISCYIMYKTWYIVATLQGALMCFYQLDRLFYCFSQNKTYTAKAYPFGVFVVMYIYGAIITLCPIGLWYLIDIQHGKCFLDSDDTFYDSFNRRAETERASVPIIFAFQVFDFCTLFLYAGKVWTLRLHLRSVNETKAQQRIMSILQRILLLTLMYEVVAIIGLCFIGIMWYFQVSTTATGPWSVVPAMTGSVSISYSMYLMQQHNTNEYRQFLTALKTLRLHYVCCFCCLRMIASEIEQHSMEHDVAECVENSKKQEEERDNKTVEETVNETQTMEVVKMQHSLPAQLSVETVVDR